MLNLYRGVRVLNRRDRTIEVDAGTHLGPDPSDPTGEADFKTSLLGQIWKLGWMLSNLGGITHQTVSGLHGDRLVGRVGFALPQRQSRRLPLHRRERPHPHRR
jgi:hypothetical protein